MTSVACRTLQSEREWQQLPWRSSEQAYLRRYVRRGVSWRGCRVKAASSPENLPQLGLILECDGVLVDTHMDGHRIAFNRAFGELGLDCAAWDRASYHDLLRAGDGSAEGMVVAWFNTVGWPATMPTSDRSVFPSRVHALKRKHLRLLVQNGQLPLRPGVETVVDDALREGVKLAVVAGTMSSPEDGIVEAAMAKLGAERASRVRVFSVNLEAQQGGEDGDEASSQLTFEQSMQLVQAKMKREVANSMLESVRQTGLFSETPAVGMAVDPSLLASGARMALLSSSWLAACIATMDLPLSRCAFLTANNATLQAARGGGLLTAAVPASRSGRGGFADAELVFDGFGPGGGATWSRLRDKLLTRGSSAT
eukprot:jgi/Botrbrau1/14411/Bobra.0014s0058.1